MVFGDFHFCFFMVSYLSIWSLPPNDRPKLFFVILAVWALVIVILVFARFKTKPHDFDVIIGADFFGTLVPFWIIFYQSLSSVRLRISNGKITDVAIREKYEWAYLGLRLKNPAAFVQAILLRAGSHITWCRSGRLWGHLSQAQITLPLSGF